MFLMDCMAQIELATAIGRDDAVTVLQARFDAVNAGMLKTLWNETAGYFQNKRSQNLTAVERMAPTHFYPLLAGPKVGPSEAQAVKTIKVGCLRLIFGVGVNSCVAFGVFEGVVDSDGLLLLLCLKRTHMFALYCIIFVPPFISTNFVKLTF
jgi:hypothetical protein